MSNSDDFAVERRFFDWEPDPEPNPDGSVTAGCLIHCSDDYGFRNGSRVPFTVEAIRRSIRESEIAAQQITRRLRERWSLQHQVNVLVTNALKLQRPVYKHGQLSKNERDVGKMIVNMIYEATWSTMSETQRRARSTT